MLMFASLVAACHAPRPGPRTYFDFMEDGIAREGVLTRCNRDRDATLNDQECSNARRAAAAIALEQERSRSEGLARESARKLTALRDRATREARTEQAAESAARADAQAAYDRLWPNPEGQRLPGQDRAAAPAFGAPLGPLLPSLSDAGSTDPAETGRVPGLPRLSPAPIEPPTNTVEIVPPEVRPEDIALAPERLRAAAN